MNAKLKYYSKRYGFILVMFAFATMIITGNEIPYLEKSSDYLVHIMVSFLALGLIFLILNKDKFMLSSLAICGVMCVFLKNESNSSLVRPVENGSPTLSVAHINLSNVSDEFELIATLNDNKIDVISFQEYTPDWSNIIHKVLKNSHPYQSDLVRIDPYGKGIYSKYPIAHIDTIKHQNSNDLEIEINVAQQSFTLMSSYITPALDKRSKINAKNQLSHLGRMVNTNDDHIIVLGEYNMVYWANEIRKFRNKTGLQNSRRDILPASLKVPYDHIFYSEDLNCLALNDLTLSDGARIGVMSKFQYKSQQYPKNVSKVQSAKQ